MARRIRVLAYNGHRRITVPDYVADNPTIQNMLADSRIFGMAPGIDDIDMVKQNPPKSCPDCGAIRHFKPTVGAYKCTGCGKISLT